MGGIRRTRSWRNIAVVAFVASISLAGIAPVIAQEATPASQTGPPFTLPFAPPPELCTLEPRPIEDYEALVGTPVSIFPPITITAGPPPDQETIDGIVDTFVRFSACLNAVDPLRWGAAFTDAGFAEDSGNAGLSEEVLDWIASPHEPAPAEEWDVVFAMYGFQQLPDGRVAVILHRGPDGLGGVDLMIFAKEGDRWLIDLWVDETWDIVYSPGPAPDDAAAASTPTN